MDFSLYENLSENAQQLLCYYLIYCVETGKRMTEIWYVIKRYHFEQFDGSSALKELKDADIFVDAGRDWYNNAQLYGVRKCHYVPALLYTYAKRGDLLTKYKKTKTRQAPMHEELRTSLEEYVKSKFTKANKAALLNEYGYSYQFLCFMATEEKMINYFVCMTDKTFSEFCSKTLNIWIESDKVESTAVLETSIRKNKNITERLRYRLLARCDIYNYIAKGVNPSEGVYQKVPEGQLHIALMLAKAGKYDKAVEIFENHRPKIDAYEGLGNSVLNFYYVLCLMHVDNPYSRELLKEFVAHVNDDDVTLPALVIADDFLKIKHKQDALAARLNKMCLLAEDKNKQYFLQKCYADLICAYFGRSQHDGKGDNSNFIANMAIICHEMIPFKNVPEERKAELTKCYGTVMPLADIPHKAEWQTLLEKITAEVQNKKPKDQLVQDDVRLMYVRHDRYSDKIEVREQKRLKNGMWGSGKLVSDQRLMYGNLPYLNEIDHRIISRYRNVSYINLKLTDCVEELIGSDRLYYGMYAPFEQVKVERDIPYLMVEKEDSRFVVRSNVTLQSLEKNPVVVEKSTTHYTVMNLTEQEKSWYKQLLEIASFPLDAEESLRAFLPAIGGKIEVHSSLIEGGSTLPIVDGSSTVGFKLSPHSNSNYDVEVFVRPLIGGSRTYTPGKGDATIIDENEEGRVRVKRDLAAEKANTKEAKAVWKEAGLKSINSGEYPPEFVLDLIHCIQSNSDKYYAEWPEGQTLRLRSLGRTSGNWNGVVKARGQWFEIEGEIQIDDNTVLSISKLLELISHSHGKYVRMNDGEYLMLSEKLKNQLRSLETVANRERGKLKISPFSVALLNDDLVNGEISITLDKKVKDIKATILGSSEYKPEVPKELNATLRPYQVDGYQWIARLNSWGAGALLADDMGLGKTVQTIAFLLLKSNEGPSLVVAPASVAPNWKVELEKFAPTLNCEILNFAANRKKTIDEAKAGDVIITTYGILLSIQSIITAKQWNVVCLDEAHIIKNRGAKTSAAAMKIQAANRVMLTGTPVQNHLGELWSLFQFVNPGMLGSYENFSQKFIIPIEGNQDKEKQLMLDRIVHPFMLRRTKQAVLKELPDKTEIYQPVQLSKEELAIYEGIRMRAESMLENNMATKSGGSEVDMNVLAEITRLRQAACSAQIIEPKWTGESSKVTTLVELLQGIIGSDNRTLVFSQFVTFFDIVRRELDKLHIPYFYIDGSVPVKKRTELVKKFQDGQCPVFLISLKAGGLGLNLTGANYVIHLDPWWNPAIEQQATDRAYRIGQKQAVTVYHLVSKNTIEEKIIRLHQTKRDLADNLLEGTDVSHKLTGEELLEMLKK